MALEAENMTYDDLKEVVEGLTCRPIHAVYTPEQPRRIFNITTLPMRDLSANDNPVAHCPTHSLPSPFPISFLSLAGDDE